MAYDLSWLLSYDLVCFQVVEHGYEFFAKRQLVTVFSAPNYCGELDHAGALISVDENLMCSFQILKPAEKKSNNDVAGLLRREAETALLGGALEDSIHMPDPLPSMTPSSASMLNALICL
ncbi:hypothetical protein RHGRI_009694 [Rhododendron griersonianum]|uniref:protein-serine/threonine phosphatase n=1 Tax=Rhododendron griersonianum TaxID=479676 RepID=A0AAV6KFQ3_9ERIC|nr:hypothetical protein RHGRI_009694 [Rhododendron griersonianum]